MGRYPYWGTAGAAPFLAIAALITACGAEDALRASGEFSPDASGRDPGTPPPLNDAIREDFDNTELIEEKSADILHDINLGRLTLRTRDLSVPSANGATYFTGPADADGPIEAASITVSDRGTLQGADTVELRAGREVRVIGRVIAGAGGVTILAGQRIVILGQIDSLGPVRLLVAQPDGEIIIAGQVTTRAGLDPSDPDAPAIEVAGRGRFELSGELVTRATSGRQGGDIMVDVYGNVVVDDGLIRATADFGGRTGHIRVRSEQAVELVNGARIGLSSADAPDTAGGDVEIDAAAIRVDGRSAVGGGRGVEKGATVQLTASGTLDIEAGGRVESGRGPEGGDMTARARAVVIGVGATLRGGLSDRQPGAVSIEAVERLSMESDAYIAASSTLCGPGGPLKVRVGGPIFASPNATFLGGSTVPLSQVSTCGQTYPAGRINILAREAEGVRDITRPGLGFPQSDVSILEDPSIDVVAPDLTSGIDGTVRSRTIDRGSDALEFTPTLVELDAETPPGTRIEIGLSGSDQREGPFVEWTNLSASASELQALQSKRFVRYRVELYGREFDAPWVEYLEIRLKPPVDAP